MNNVCTLDYQEAVGLLLFIILIFLSLHKDWLKMNVPFKKATTFSSKNKRFYSSFLKNTPKNDE